MARKQPKKNEPASEEGALAALDLESAEPVATELAGEVVVTEERPSITSPEWGEYVMRQFLPGELDDQGKPYVHGLRRVGELLLGVVLESTVRVVQAPVFAGVDFSLLTTPVVVEHTLKLMVDGEKEGPPYPVTYSEVADGHQGNIDPAFMKFCTATTATRTEARNWRKALRLRGCAAEETSLPMPAQDGKINATQVNFLDLLCKRCDIDVLAYVNCGAGKYARVSEVPFGLAVKMVEKLSLLQNDPSKIKPDIRGYKVDWKEAS